MKFSKFIVASVLMATITFAASGQISEVTTQRNATSQIEKYENDFSGALARNDVAALQQLLSEDWKIISGDGSFITKARFLDVLKSGALKHDSMTFDSRSVRLYGKVALVTEHARSGGSYQGAAFHTDEISTDIIVNTRGKWICVLTQLTTISPK